MNINSSAKSTSKKAEEAEMFVRKRQNLLNKISDKMKELTSSKKDLIEKASTDICFFDWKVMFSSVFEEGNGFDLVIGNPPYLRIQGIRDDDPTFADILTKTYKCATGKFDLYVPFVEKGVSLCKKNGMANFIMPTKWTNADYGLGMRTFILGKQLSVKIINFSSYQVFNASTYSGVQWLIKNNCSKIEYLQLNHDLATAEELKKFLESIHNEDYAINSLKDFSPKPWKLASNKDSAQVLSKINKYPKLKSILKYISQGTVTVGDDIFIMEGYTEGKYFYGYSQEAKKNVCLEANIMKPLLKGEDVKRYNYPTASHYIIYPHHKVKGKTVPYTETEMQTLFPKTYAYMLAFKNKLIEKKNKYKTNSIYWYSLHRSRDIAMFESTKILTPEISFGCNMTIDDKHLYHNTQNYTLLPEAEYEKDIKSILGILNSKLFWFFISNTGSILRGGYFRFKTKYIESFPFPSSKIEDDICNKIGELVSNIFNYKNQDADTSLLEQEIDRLVYKLYDLTYAEVKIVDPNTPITEEEYNK